MNASTIALIELTLKGTALLLAGCGGALLLARSSAAHRSLWWGAVFATLLLLPLALIVRPVWTLPVQAEPAAHTPPIASRSVPPEVDVMISKTTAAARLPGWRPMSLGEWLLAGYGCGVALVLGFRMLGSGALWSLRRAAAANADAQAAVDRWREASGMRRQVRVFTSARVTVPMTWGTWRPVIVFPENCGTWSREEFDAAMQHELAHVRHFDAARRWLGTMVAALWWPHPLVWVAQRAWKLEQERACDDAVLASGGDATAYARQLLTAAHGLRLSPFQTAAALIMAMPAGLETRLRAVMSDRADRSPVRRRALFGLGTMTALTLAGGIAVQAQLVNAPPPAATAAANPVEKKAAETIIPRMEFREATPTEALEFISVKAGLRIIYTRAPADEARISLSLTNIPAAEALKYVTGLADLTLKYTDDTVIVTALPTPAGSAGGNPARRLTTEWRGPRNHALSPESAALKIAQGIIIPVVDFHEATLSEALEFLRQKAITLDPAKQGVSILLKPGSDPNVKMTIRLEKVPLDEVLRYVAGLSGLVLRADSYALVLEPKAAEVSK